jgi:hypothetical protein
MLTQRATWPLSWSAICGTAAPGEGGMLVGRRVANAWLVVDGGNSTQQRLTVLTHLHAYP